MFTRVSDLRWTEQGRPPSIDASGEGDYGSIDTFDVEGTSYHLVGDFGEIVLTSPSAPSLVLQGTNRPPDNVGVSEVTRQ